LLGKLFNKNLHGVVSEQNSIN